MRLIIVSTENGEREDVIFTEDNETPAADYCDPGQTVSYDEEINCELPSIFPLEYTLRRS